MTTRDPMLSPVAHENPFSLQSAKARKSIASARGGGRFFVNAMLYMAPHKFAGDSEIGKKIEVLHPTRRNPSEDDLLGEGPTAPYVPGSVPPMLVPSGATGSDRLATSRLGCGGYGTGPMVDR